MNSIEWQFQTLKYGSCGRERRKVAVEVEARVAKLKGQRESMITYLLLKVNSEDWHGVADAAMDLREIDATMKVLREEV